MSEQTIATLRYTFIILENDMLSRREGMVSVKILSQESHQEADRLEIPHTWQTEGLSMSATHQTQHCPIIPALASHAAPHDSTSSKAFKQW